MADHSAKHSKEKRHSTDANGTGTDTQPQSSSVTLPTFVSSSKGIFENLWQNRTVRIITYSIGGLVAAYILTILATKSLNTAANFKNAIHKFNSSGKPKAIVNSNNANLI